MVIMGVDPGTAITGYGVIGYSGGVFRVRDYGAIRTDSRMELPERLGLLYRGLKEIMDRHRPDHVAVEELFFNKNVKTALAVGHARGVAMLAAVQSGVPVFEYTPLQVKQAVVGQGRAAKEQVQFMVRVLLCLKEKPSPDDVADALAVGICHAFRWSGTEALLR
ncbi:MAG: crossover junction endodeoxyribonuclease RuvC [Peptococcaceae bacterium]|nr:crossover junction endodeoxyribonuclease RuvC [Peptococcaceae bacterium]